MRAPAGVGPAGWRCACSYDYVNGHTENGAFCKPGSNAHSESRHWQTMLTALWLDAQRGSALVELALPEDASAKCALGTRGQGRGGEGRVG